MNIYIRAIFLPIMILAGIFTSTMCALIFAPIALYHWYKERKLIPEDINNNEKYIESFHAQFKKQD